MSEEQIEQGSWEFLTIASPVDRESIRYAIWKKQEVWKQAIVYLNGRSEWIEKYNFLPTELGLAEETAFISLDHRGQGGSSGTRAHANDYNEFSSDVAAVIADAVGEKPYVMMAHSMGGLIALHGILQKKYSPLALALSAPLLGLPRKPVPHVLARPVAKVAQKIGCGRYATGVSNKDDLEFGTNPLTHDYTAFHRIMTSPYPFASPTYGWVNASFAAIDFITQEDVLKKFCTPTLLFVGSKETVVDAAALSPWVRRVHELSGATIHFETIPGARHELFNEARPIRQLVFAKTLDFFSGYMKL